MAIGLLSGQMVAHILLMNLAAPLLALAWLGARPPPAAARALWPATVTQLALLWLFHVPAVAGLAGAWLPHLAMQLLLLASALWFWLAALAPGARRWQALLALLLSGKLFCLLGVLLVFAPRLLYPEGALCGASSLADQQLAGLLMLVACPASYLVAAVVVAVRWLGVLEGGDGAAGRHAGA